MILEGNTQVLEAMREKKRLMDAGLPHHHLKLLLIVDGGLMKGAYGAGICQALADDGYDVIWDSVVGISSGAPTVSYLLSGNVDDGASVMYEECCSPEFANFNRLSNQINFQYFIEVLQKHPTKKLNVDRILTHQTKLYYGVTDFYTAEPELITPVDEEGIFLGIEASISMPNVTTSSVFINGKRYADGGFARPHIIGKAIEEIQATHILLLTNQDKTTAGIPWHEQLLNNTLFRFRMTYALRVAANTRRNARHRILDALRKNKKIKLLSIWGDGSISSLEQNGAVVRSVINKSRLWWRRLYSVPKRTD